MGIVSIIFIIVSVVVVAFMAIKTISEGMWMNGTMARRNYRSAGLTFEDGSY